LIRPAWTIASRTARRVVSAIRDERQAQRFDALAEHGQDVFRGHRIGFDEQGAATSSVVVSAPPAKLTLRTAVSMPKTRFKRSDLARTKAFFVLV
jgi:hypothetical protein